MLMEAIAGLVNLKYLEFSDSVRISDDAVQSLVDSLCQSRCQLHELNLESYGFGVAEVNAVARVLSNK